MKQVTTYPRMLPKPTKSCFVLGPRGTGKSTWLKQKLPDAAWFDLLDQRLFQSFLADPGELAAALRPLARGSWVVIDEIQRVPELLNEVHRAIEDLGLRFALSGSSARKLRRSGVNLLGGRARQVFMFPFVPEELGKDFQLSRALRYGTLPLILGNPEPEREGALRDYVDLYLKEEIRAEALVRNLGGFTRFLPISALFHGQTLSISSLARDAEVERKTVQGFVEILEDTLLALRLKAFSGKLRVREKKHPKLYWIDPGLVRSLQGARGDPTELEKGALFEGYVFMLLRAYQAKQDLYDEITYWSPSEATRTEVDFLLIRGSKKIAIEVKSTPRLRPDFKVGLEAIHGLAGLERRIIVYLGSRRLELPGGIEVLPFPEFCRELSEQKLW